MPVKALLFTQEALVGACVAFCSYTGIRGSYGLGNGKDPVVCPGGNDYNAGMPNRLKLLWVLNFLYL